VKERATGRQSEISKRNERNITSVRGIYHRRSRDVHAGMQAARVGASRTCEGRFAAHDPAQPPAPAGGGSGGAGGSARAPPAAPGDPARALQRTRRLVWSGLALRSFPCKEMHMVRSLEIKHIFTFPLCYDGADLQPLRYTVWYQNCRMNERQCIAIREGTVPFPGLGCAFGF